MLGLLLDLLKGIFPSELPCGFPSIIMVCFFSKGTVQWPIADNVPDNLQRIKKLSYTMSSQHNLI